MGASSGGGAVLRSASREIDGRLYGSAVSLIARRLQSFVDTDCDVAVGWKVHVGDGGANNLRRGICGDLKRAYL